MALRASLVIIGLALCFLIPIYFESLLDFLVIKVGAGWVFSTFYLRLMVIIFFAIALNSFFSFFSKSRKIKMWVTFLIAIVPGAGISMIAPIWEGDYASTPTSDSYNNMNISELQTETKGLFGLESDNQLVCFFTAGCPHCMECSKKLGKNIDAGMQLKVTAFFPGVPHDAQLFLERNNGENFEYYCISQEAFIGNSAFDSPHASFPVTMLINSEGKTVNFWQGNTISFNSMDYLLDMEVSYK